MQAMVAAAATRFGGIDIVVNNAGLSKSASLLETDGRRLGPAVPGDGARHVPRGQARRQGDDRPGHRRRSSCTSPARTRSSPGPTTSPTGPRRPVRPTRSGCWPRSWASTASASTASTPTAWSRARASSPAAGAPSVPRSTACRSAELGQFYASRTLLKREVLPEHVANAAFMPRQRRALPHDRPHHPRRRRARRGVPAMSQDAGQLIEQDRIAELNAPRARTTSATSRTPSTCSSARGVDASGHREALAAFSVAAPSWALGTGGTRFGRFPIGGRAAHDRGEDRRRRRDQRAHRRQPLDLAARAVGRPGRPRRAGKLRRRAGIAFDAMNSNTFQDNPSTTRRRRDLVQVRQPLPHRRRRPRRRRRAQPLRASTSASSSARRRSPSGSPTAPASPDRRTSAASSSARRRSAPHLRRTCPTTGSMFTEHKPYEPQFYSSVVTRLGLVADARAGGRRPGACASSISATTCRTPTSSRSSRGWRWSGASAASTSTTPSTATTTSPPGRIKPYQLFLIFLELLDAGGGAMPDLAYMIDQSNNLKDPLEDLHAGDRRDAGRARAGAARRPRALARRAGGQRPRARAGDPAPRVPHRRPAARRRGAPPERRRPRPARHVPRPRLPRADDRRARAATPSRPACEPCLCASLAVDLGATCVRVASSTGRGRVAAAARACTARARPRCATRTAACGGTGTGSSRRCRQAARRRARPRAPSRRSASTAWGVDYGLLDATGELVSPP